MIPVTSQLKSAVPIRFPARPCCNCGSRSQVTLVSTRLYLVSLFVGLAGVEKSVTVSLPFCPRCIRTSRRAPWGLFARGLLLVLTFFLLLFVASLARPAPGGSTEGLLLLVAGADLAVIGGLFALQRPRGGQTSYFQPVRLVRLKQRFLDGAVTGFVLGFTSPVYRQAFAGENQDVIQQGAVEVREA